jgi:hypothetical protein
MTDHCNGCGVTGDASGEPAFDLRSSSIVILKRTPASYWPDNRARLLCGKCHDRLGKHIKRLRQANTGWGHLT